MYVYVHCTWRETGCMHVRKCALHMEGNWLHACTYVEYTDQNWTILLRNGTGGEMVGMGIEPTTFSSLAVFLKTRGMKL